MTRIHACLDGELPRHELSPAEARELALLERDLAPVVMSLRVPAQIDFRAEVLQSLPLTAPPLSWLERTRAAVKTGWAWFWAPRSLTLQWRPSLVCATLLALVVALPWHAVLETGQQTPTALTAAESPVFVQFRLDAAHVSSVSVAGSFSAWQPTIELRESAPGIWTALVPLTPGVHDYLFLVDESEWVADPGMRPVEDDFGGVNSRLYLTIPSTAL